MRSSSSFCLLPLSDRELYRSDNRLLKKKKREMKRTKTTTTKNTAVLLNIRCEDIAQTGFNQSHANVAAKLGLLRGFHVDVNSNL